MKKRIRKKKRKLVDEYLSRVYTRQKAAVGEYVDHLFAHDPLMLHLRQRAKAVQG